jgi:glucose-6-phosphate-specific signal transduction histidine kinase
MTFWKRLLITLAAMLVVSYLAGLGWRNTFNSLMPSYLAGIIGGLVALPVWEWLKPKK